MTHRQASPKNIIITGANQGIGFQTMKQLYLQGNNVIFGCRTVELNHQAIQKVKSVERQQNSSFASFSNQNHVLKSFHLDLTKKQSIIKFVQNISKQFQHVDILINNAGTITFNRQIIEQTNTQRTLTVNYYGHFYLTYLLFDKIKKSKDARIINISASSYQFVHKRFFSDLRCQSKLFDYNKQFIISKFMLVVFTVELAKRMQSKGINNVKVFSLHPGLVDTKFGTGNCLMDFYKSICCCCYKKASQGARTSIFLSTQPIQNLKNGEFYDQNTQTKEIDFRAKKQEVSLQLWKISQEVYGIKFQI